MTGYQSRFHEGKWDKKASIRIQREHAVPFEEDKYFFSASLCPILQHPLFESSDEATRRTIMVHQLYLYLKFTVKLEMGPVNGVTTQLAGESLLPWLPRQMKDDAIKIVTDEAGHADMSNELVRRTEQYTGIPSFDITPKFLDDLDRLTSGVDPHVVPALRLFFVIISETLITGSLSRLPNDPSLQVAVRNVARDHAKDESNHHAYFKALFEMLWPRLPLPVQRVIGGHLPDLIFAFLGLDIRATTRILETMPEYASRASQIANELAELPVIIEGVIGAANPTLKMLRAAGVFEDPYISTAFADKGFIQEAVA